MNLTDCDRDYNYPTAMDLYEEDEDILVGMLRGLSRTTSQADHNRYASTSTIVPRMPRRSCLRNTNTIEVRQQKSVAFSETILTRHYSPEHRSSEEVWDHDDELRPIGYVCEHTKSEAVQKRIDRCTLVSEGDIHTCIAGFQAGGSRISHTPVQVLIDLTRRQLNWTQHKAIGNAIRPMSRVMSLRVNDAAKWTDRQIRKWMREGQLEGARLQSCTSVHNKENLEAFVKIYRNYVEARDESNAAWVKMADELMGLKGDSRVGVRDIHS